MHSHDVHEYIIYKDNQLLQLGLLTNVRHMHIKVSVHVSPYNKKLFTWWRVDFGSVINVSDRCNCRSISGNIRHSEQPVNNHVFYVYKFIWANNMSSAIRHHLLGIWARCHWKIYMLSCSSDSLSLNYPYKYMLIIDADVLFP